jgi:Mrp family chromosome partitioning ATPase
MTWQTGFIQSEDVKIHYYRQGAGVPLIMAHGFSDSGACWQAFAQHFVDEYDVILIDTPPILGLSDARLIGSQTDGIILVIRLEKTRKDHVYSALDSLNIANLNLLGVVVNDVKKNFGSYDYGYNYYNRYYRKKSAENIVKTNGSNVIS